MDSFEFNKIAAAILAALVVIFGGKTLVEIAYGEHDEHSAKAGFTLPVEVASSHGTAGAASKAKKASLDYVAVAKAMQAATADSGAGIFKKCKSCHTTTEGGKNSSGPNLWNVVGRDRGSASGFKYSKAMMALGGKWDFETLAKFIGSPKKWLKGTKMSFAGLSSPEAIASLLVYLRSKSGSPVALPNVADVEKAQAAPAEPPKAH